MKVAVLSFDLAAFKMASILKQEDHELVFFVKEMAQDFAFDPYSNIPIYCEHVMIPSDVARQTASQKAIFSKCAGIYKDLCARLASLSTPGLDSVTELGKNRVVSTNDIVDIQYNPKTKKTIIEIGNSGVEAFDYLITESHPLFTDYLKSKKIEIFKSVTEPTYVWCSANFEFELVKPLVEWSSARNFFVIMDPERMSLIDNWFYCRLNKNRIEVWGYQPHAQINNPEFQNFYLERIRNMLTNKLSFLHLHAYLGSDVSTVNYESLKGQQAKISLPQATAVPNFSFWTGEQIGSFLESNILKNLRKLKIQSEAVK